MFWKSQAAHVGCKEGFLDGAPSPQLGASLPLLRWGDGVSKIKS